MPRILVEAFNTLGRSVDGIVVLRLETPSPAEVALPPRMPIVVGDFRFADRHTAVGTDQAGGTRQAAAPSPSMSSSLEPNPDPDPPPRARGGPMPAGRVATMACHIPGYLSLRVDAWSMRAGPDIQVITCRRDPFRRQEWAQP